MPKGSRRGAREAEALAALRTDEGPVMRGPVGERVEGGYVVRNVGASATVYLCPGCQQDVVGRTARRGLSRGRRRLATALAHAVLAGARPPRPDDRAGPRPPMTDIRANTVLPATARGRHAAHRRRARAGR